MDVFAFAEVSAFHPPEVLCTHYIDTSTDLVSVSYASANFCVVAYNDQSRPHRWYIIETVEFQTNTSDLRTADGLLCGFRYNPGVGLPLPTRIGGKLFSKGNPCPKYPHFIEKCQVRIEVLPYPRDYAV